MAIKRTASFLAAIMLLAGLSGIAASAKEGLSMGTNDILIDLRGEVRSVAQAQEILRGLGGDEPVTVWIKGGAYPEPMEFTAADRGNVTWRAAPGEEVIFTGAKEITGWQADTVNGVGCWSARLEQGEYFTSLYHPTEQLSRPRYPAQGFLFVDHVEGADMAPHDSQPQYHSSFLSFFAKPGDLRQFHAPRDVTLRILHFWKDEISNLGVFNEASNELSWQRPTAMTINPNDRYFLENVFEALKLPGQWYLDREDTKLYYIPFAGESMESTVLYAAVHERMLTIDGGSNIAFQGISFQNTAWGMPNGGYNWGMPAGWDCGDRDSSQAAYDVRPAVLVTNSTGVRFDGCKFNNIGATALKLGSNVQDSGVVNCEFTQIGANAVFIEGENLPADDPRVNQNITVKNNLIAHYGRRFFNAIGVLNIHARHIEISHNEIYDGYYTAISSGWRWGYDPHPTDYVAIENNLIHTIGQGWLSDMGGIYTLGTQMNSVIRGNVIHDVAADPLQGGYGGWGIYLDEGTSGMLVEKNLVYSCGSQGFHQHYGKENLVRNNIFVFNKEGQIRVSRKEEHTSIILERNIIIGQNQPMYTSVQAGKFRDDKNLYWNYGFPWWPYSGDEAFFSRRGIVVMWFMGYYRNGVFRNPQFADATRLDFTLDPNSPAIHQIGFELWDTSAAGRIAMQNLSS